jgi:hypothetical protein
MTREKHNPNRIVKTALKGVGYFFLGALLFASVPYAVTPVYDFPDVRPFAGENLHNPYADASGAWYKANLQAHSGAWGGTTDGALSPRDLYRVYDSLGYDVIGITNYMNIYGSPVETKSYIPMYEHGYNVWKRHHLAIGAREVVWRDYVLFQTLSHKQHMLNVIRPTTEILTIAHPKFMDGFAPEDFRHLTNYDYVEVLNHYRISLKHWDAALAAGEPVWGMGNDDSHDQRKASETGRYWNMIRAESESAEDVLAALKRGDMYCVAGEGGVMDNGLVRVSARPKGVLIELEKPANSIRFVGSGGVVRDSVARAKRAYYRFKKDDPYIRVEVANPKTTFYLNPVYRYDDDPRSAREASVNYPLSVLYWLAFLGGYVGVGYLFVRSRRKRREEGTTEPRKPDEIK